MWECLKRDFQDKHPQGLRYLFEYSVAVIINLVFKSMIFFKFSLDFVGSSFRFFHMIVFVNKPSSCCFSLGYKIVSLLSFAYAVVVGCKLGVFSARTN